MVAAGAATDKPDCCMPSKQCYRRHEQFQLVLVVVAQVVGRVFLVQDIRHCWCRMTQSLQLRLRIVIAGRISPSIAPYSFYYEYRFSVTSWNMRETPAARDLPQYSVSVPLPMFTGPNPCDNLSMGLISIDYESTLSSTSASIAGWPFVVSDIQPLQ